MQKLYERFASTLGRLVPLHTMHVLEINGGDDSHSFLLATRSKSLTVISSDLERIKTLRRRRQQKIHFAHGSAEALAFKDSSFDMVIFTLSFFRVPPYEMDAVIDEAIRVVKKDGHVVFLEPSAVGTFYEAQKMFGLAEGDQSFQKEASREVIQAHPGLRILAEHLYVVKITFVTFGDFITTMLPSENLNDLESYLISQDLKLEAGRQMTICTLV